jgi:ubiquinone/menaquinone biosynthesis C-methylase UbiE
MAGTLQNSIPAPFDSIASTYDETFSASPVGRAQRGSVWNEITRAFHPGQHILEINCGTGIDAVHMSLQGIHVEACDSSIGMIKLAEQRASTFGEHLSVRFRCLPIEKMGELDPERTFDGALSNFSGLNCVEDLDAVVRNLACLVKTRGRIVVCIFGTFCLWEILWYLSKGNIHKAFRRVRHRYVDVTLAPATPVRVRYWSVANMKRVFAPCFQLKRMRGVGVIVPPSYAASLAGRFPRLFRLATVVDPWLGGCPIVRLMADHVVLTFERTEDPLP